MFRMPRTRSSYLALAAVSVLLAGGTGFAHAQAADNGTAILKSHRISVGTPVKVTVLKGTSSDSAQVGDHIRVKVASSDTSGLPAGTIFVGRVTRAVPASNKRAGELEIQFAIPDQDETGPESSDNPPSEAFTDVASARLLGKAPSADKANLAPIGAGAGAILGLSRHRRLGDAIEGAILGGAGGYAVDQAQKHSGGDIALTKGSETTLHLDTALTLRTEIVAPY